MLGFDPFVFHIVLLNFWWLPLLATQQQSAVSILSLRFVKTS